MMGKILTACAIVAAGLLATGLHLSVSGTRPAQAADAKHMFAVHGVGAMECSDMSKILAAQNNGIRPALASWMLGYVTAMNRSDTGMYDATPVQEQAALVNMVIGVCQKHAALPVETVVYAVFSSLEKAKLPVASPEVMLSAGTAHTVIRQATLQQVQQFLVTKKYMQGDAANGKFGPMTEAALVKFQTAQHLPATGLPDADTVVRALVETP